MKPETLLEWSRNPSSMPVSALEELRRCLQVYPCFYTARMLYLKILRQNEDLDYASELFQTSLSSPDRRQLLHFIRKDALRYENPTAGEYGLNAAERESFVDVSPVDDFALSEVAGEELAAADTAQHFDASELLTLDQSADAFALIDRFLDHESSPSQPDYAGESSLYSVEMAFEEPRQAQDDTEILQAIMASDASSPQEPITDNSLESFTFDESGEIPEASFTLTLAKIYLKQKKYGRALEILQALVLKNPEKSIYFADQIKYLERIINHLNK